MLLAVWKTGKDREFEAIEIYQRAFSRSECNFLGENHSGRSIQILRKVRDSEGEGIMATLYVTQDGQAGK